MRLKISKDAYKFSSAHMTVFPDGSKENLHGHNYQVEVEIELSRAPNFSEMIDFRAFKDPLKELCSAWDEKVILATANPHFRMVQSDAHESEFLCAGRRYVLPTPELVLLPTDNITSENLAVLMIDAYVARLQSWIPAVLRPTRVRLSVLETRGQGAETERTLA